MLTNFTRILRFHLQVNLHFIDMQPDLKFTGVSESAAIGFSGLGASLYLLRALCPHAEPGSSMYLKNLKVTLKENTFMFTSTSASLSRGKEVAAHFSTSAIEGKISSYRLQFISSPLCAQQNFENGSFSLSLCSTDQVVE